MGAEYAVLWEAECSGAFSSFRDYLELCKRANGAFSLRLKRRNLDFARHGTVFRSALIRALDPIRWTV